MIASKLLQPARTRSLIDDLLLWSLLPLLAAAAVWRWHGAATAALTAIAGLILLTVFAWRRTHRFDRQWLIRQLDARRADMEDSADLLFSEEARLNPLQQLQRTRLQQRLRIELRQPPQRRAAIKHSSIKKIRR